MINSIKIYTSQSTNPYYNLALEKYLFDTVSEGSAILYLWQNDNTIVIGANQNPWAECDLKAAESDKVKIARRISGGGAVFHDLGNLNFTFISRTEDYDLNKNLEVIKKAVGFMGICAEISGRNDILCAGKKFSGNAFYNSGGKSYHHGTILVNTDFEKMKKYLTPSQNKLSAKGVKSVSSRVINLSEINSKITVEKTKQCLVSAFESVFNMKADVIDFIDEPFVLKLSQEYGSWNYIFKKTAPFTLSLSSRFEFGEITLNLDIRNGIIESCDVFTDSMDYTFAQSVRNAIINSKFDRHSVYLSLSKSLDKSIAKDIASLV